MKLMPGYVIRDPDTGCEWTVSQATFTHSETCFVLENHAGGSCMMPGSELDGWRVLRIATPPSED